MARYKNEKLNKKDSWFVKGTYFDYPTLFLILFLVFFGLVMIYSASYYTAIGEHDKMGLGKYFYKQLGCALLGFLAMFVAANLKYQKVVVYCKLLMIVAIVLQCLTFFGEEVNGSRRWIKILGVQFQPSEIAKMVLIIYVAYVCTAYERDLYSFKLSLYHLLVPLVLVGIIAVENLSTAIICAVIVFGIYFIATPKPLNIVYFAIIGAVALTMAILLEGYRGQRFVGWKNTDSNQGYQTRQALYAIGSGGVFGRGLGNGLQKLGSIPESHNDMIYAVVCEELGIVGAIGLIIIVLLLVWRLRFIAEGAADRVGALMVVGIMAHISVQVLVNICVVTNVIPNTGVPFPFVSYGGTSIAVLLAEMGIALSVARQIVPKGREKGVVS